MKKYFAVGSLLFMSLASPVSFSETAPNGVPSNSQAHSSQTEFPSNYFGVDMPIYVKSEHPEVTIRLPANRSTGYSWLLVSYNRDEVTPVSSHYNPPVEGQIGAAGESVWVFRVSQSAFQVPHVIRISMAYVRPSEMNVNNIKTILLITEPADTDQQSGKNKNQNKKLRS